MFDALKNAPCRAVGATQVLRAVSSGTARKVYLAQDVEEYLSEKILAACREAGIEAECCGTMKELGKACGIEVRAACAAILCL